MYSVTTKRKQSLAEDYTNLFGLLSVEFPELFPPELYTQAAYIWAISTVWSRSFIFNVEGSMVPVFVPFADMLGAPSLSLCSLSLCVLSLSVFSLSLFSLSLFSLCSLSLCCLSLCSFSLLSLSVLSLSVLSLSVPSLCSLSLFSLLSLSLALLSLFSLSATSLHDAGAVLTAMPSLSTA
eukprot:SAG31_NODE_1494_length_8106_cov_7.933183_6_plen_180_part_00